MITHSTGNQLHGLTSACTSSGSNQSLPVNPDTSLGWPDFKKSYYYLLGCFSVITPVRHPHPRGHENFHSYSQCYLPGPVPYPSLHSQDAKLTIPPTPQFFPSIPSPSPLFSKSSCVKECHPHGCDCLKKKNVHFFPPAFHSYSVHAHRGIDMVDKITQTGIHVSTVHRKIYTNIHASIVHTKIDNLTEFFLFLFFID